MELVIDAVLIVGACVLGAELHEFSHYLQARVHGREASIDPWQLEVRWTDPEPTVDRRIEVTPLVSGLAAGVLWTLFGPGWSVAAAAFWLIYTFGGSKEDYQHLIAAEPSTRERQLIMAGAGLSLAWATDVAWQLDWITSTLYWPLWVLGILVGVSQLIVFAVPDDADGLARTA